ncbi:hypothetical protein Nmel_002987, partial [Mimus melanotis]
HSLLLLPAPGKCHFRPATLWQRPPSPWGNGQEEAGEPAGGEPEPTPPSRPRAGKGRVSSPGTSRPPTATAGLFSPRAKRSGNCPPCPQWPPLAATAEARGRRGRRRSH